MERVFLTCCMILFSAVVSLTVGSSNVNDTGAGNSSLYVLLMTSSSRQFDSTGAERAVRIALERINANGAVLPGYSLQLAAVRDTKCDGSTAVREFLSQVQLPSPVIIGVIGCGCSVATPPVADLATPLYGLSLISYSPTGLTLSDQTGHFQLFPTEHAFVNSLVAVVRQFEWTQLSILTQLDQPFIKMQQMLIGEFTRINVTVLNSAQFTRNQDPADIENIFVNNSRVFFINAYEDKARQLLCSFKEEMIAGARYAWLLYGWYSEGWWRDTSNVNCTEEEMSTLLERAIVIEQHPLATDNNTALNFSFATSFVETLAYDSVWTLAVALNRTRNMIAANDIPDGCVGTPPPVPLEEFNYGNNTTSCLIRDSLSKTNFTGQSGKVQFGSDGVRPQQTAVRVLQYRNESGRLQPVKFATVRYANTQNATLYFLEGENTFTLWEEGSPPLDGRPVTVISQFKTGTIVFTYSLGIAGIIITTICLLFNAIFRNRKIIRLTSPNLNYFILTGSYLVFITPFFELPIYTNDLQIWTVNCVILVFVNNIGYSLVFSTILAKLGRIYFIFHNPLKARKRNISDWRMACFICIDVVLVVVILIIGNSIPFTRPNAHTIPDAETPPREINGTLHRFVIIHCWTTVSSVFTSLLYVHIASLQIASFVLALLNRKIDIKVLNDSHQIRGIVYITTLAAIEVLFLLFLVEPYRNVRTVLTSGHQLAATIAVNLILFVPKMVSLYKDPYGKDIFSHKQDTLKRQTSRNGTIDNVLSPTKDQQTNWQLATLPVVSPQSKLEDQHSNSISPDKLTTASECVNNKPQSIDINTAE